MSAVERACPARARGTEHPYESREMPRKSYAAKIRHPMGIPTGTPMNPHKVQGNPMPQNPGRLEGARWPAYHAGQAHSGAGT